MRFIQGISELTHVLTKSDPVKSGTSKFLIFSSQNLATSYDLSRLHWQCFNFSLVLLKLILSVPFFALVSIPSSVLCNQSSSELASLLEILLQATFLIPSFIIKYLKMPVVGPYILLRTFSLVWHSLIALYILHGTVTGLKHYLCLTPSVVVNLLDTVLLKLLLLLLFYTCL